MISVKEREIIRKHIKNFTVKNPNALRAEIVNHFSKQGIARRTIYNNINKLGTPQPKKDYKKTGRPTSWTSTKSHQLKRLVNNRIGVSQRRLAKKFQVSQSNICQQLSKMKISSFKREKIPKYDIKQQLKAKKLSRKLVNELYKENGSIIMDDEKYFTFCGENYPGNDNYYTNDREKCPDHIRFKGKDKYPKKLLMWIAISERGMSKPLFRKSSAVAINADIYIDECLNKRLLPFIHKHHSDFRYTFWPDLASAHYAGATVSWMEQNVNFVPKYSNTPNIPQARSIENFWGCLGQKVYEKGWQAKSHDQLVSRIESKLKEFDLNYLQSLMKGITSKLRNIADSGVFAIFKK